MKKALSVISAIALLASSVAATGCSKKDEATTKDGKTILNLWTFTDEVPGMVKKFMSTHPDFAAKYEVKETIIPTTDGNYQPALDKALQAGGKDAPDFFCAEAASVLKYTQGDMSSYAAPYKDLGIDVDKEIKDADIAQYSVDIGTNPNGDVVGLGYQATGGAFIYRRSVAKAAFGSDDPATVSAKIGGGSGSWDKFFEAAEELKKKGFGIVSGDGDIWHAVENSSEKGWIVDDKLFIDPKREEFLDLSKIGSSTTQSLRTAVLGLTQARRMQTATLSRSSILLSVHGATGLFVSLLSDSSGAVHGSSLTRIPRTRMLLDRSSTGSLLTALRTVSSICGLTVLSTAKAVLRTQ